MKKIFISGNFNIIHPGHQRLFKAAKELGDYLIVGVFSDKLADTGAYVEENLRLETIKSVSIIDESFLIKSSLNEVINKLKPDIVFKGKEHEKSFNEELELVESYGGKLLFGSGETVFISSELIGNEIFLQNNININIDKKFTKRHHIDNQKLYSLINDFSKSKILVLGDIIVDEYISCQPLGMSQEDPTIAVKPLDNKFFLGGAGIVASHASNLGTKVKMFSVVGDDNTNKFVFNELKKNKIEADILVDNSRPTTLKQRYRANGKTLLRVNNLHQESISLKNQEKIFQKIKDEIENYDLIVFSDFNYGFMPQPLLDRITEIGFKKNIKMVADSQSSSQLGNISRFKKMNIIFPTEREARLSMQNNDDGIITLLQKLIKQSNAKHIILKLGVDGLIIFNDKDEINFLTDKIPAINNNPKDVAGAGDALLIVSSLSYVLGANIWESAYLGSLAAALQIDKVGNIPITKSDLLNIIK